jgi:hypothetical protein
MHKTGVIHVWLYTFICPFIISSFREGRELREVIHPFTCPAVIR